ncbi:hypothetical protein [Piscinibacter sp.]|uniref:hypothetical protein n=1 Tax=Piscinibacter sp. TaxID=1903157 RepID=UPI0039E45443
MKLQPVESAPRSAAAPLLRPANKEAGVRLVCRCVGCGCTLTFDALIVSCACADEAPRADSTLH